MTLTTNQTAIALTVDRLGSILPQLVIFMDVRYFLWSVGTPQKKRLIKEVCIHHKKDGFFLHNIFIWCLEVQKSDVVLTEHCQIYGLPLTSHVILAKITNSGYQIKRF